MHGNFALILFWIFPLIIFYSPSIFRIIWKFVIQQLKKVVSVFLRNYFFSKCLNFPGNCEISFFAPEKLWQDAGKKVFYASFFHANVAFFRNLIARRKIRKTVVWLYLIFGTELIRTVIFISYESKIITPERRASFFRSWLFSTYLGFPENRKIRFNVTQKLKEDGEK